MLYRIPVLLSVAAAAAVIRGLLAFSGAALLDDGKEADAASRPASSRPASLISSLPSIATAPAELLVFVLCDGETVLSAFQDEPYHLVISLRPRTDRSAIARVIAGGESGFPATARFYYSNCALAGIERGGFP